jgi:hypothetical protein
MTGMDACSSGGACSGDLITRSMLCEVYSTLYSTRHAHLQPALREGVRFCH